MKFRSRYRSLTVALTTAALACACGGQQSPPETQPEAPSTPPMTEPPAAAATQGEPAPAVESDAGGGPAKIVWKDMSVDQKKEHMKTVVLPTMKTAFKELNPKRYAEMNCVTCHGQGATQGKFTMPNPKLPKLDPADGFKKHTKKSPEVTKFMMERVVPGMATLLDEQPYNPETQQGFGCFECHTK